MKEKDELLFDDTSRKRFFESMKELDEWKKSPASQQDGRTAEGKKRREKVKRGENK